MSEPRSEPAPILEARELRMEYGGTGWLRRSGPVVRAVDGVDLTLLEGETLGLVGESGSGKSTVARLLLGLEAPTGGRVLFRRRDLATFGRKERRRFRRSVQIVFQDPYASLNPRLRVGPALSEALRVHGLARGPAADRRVAELLELVGLDPEAARRYPHEFSGGQRQRIGVARALSVEPEVLVADEPVSALDVSVQAQVLNLLRDLQERLGLTYLFISHDLAVVRQMSDRIAVMRDGRIVEVAPARALFLHAEDAYTRTLLEAVPRVPRRARSVSRPSREGPSGSA